MKETKVREMSRKKKELKKEINKLENKIKSIENQTKRLATIEFCFDDVIGEVMDAEGTQSERLPILYAKEEEVMDLLRDYLFRYCEEQAWKCVTDVIKEITEED